MSDDTAPPFASVTATLAIGSFNPPTCTATIVAATCDPQIQVRFTPDKLTVWLPQGGAPAPVLVNFVLADSTTPYQFTGFYFPTPGSGQSFNVLAVTPAQVRINDLCNPAKMGVAFEFCGTVQNTLTGAVATFDPDIENETGAPP